MFHKILVPLDFTEENQAALKLAREMATRDGAQILLLHVIETLQDVSFEEMRDFYERLERRARTKLAQAAASFDDPAAIHQDVVYGRRPEAIVAHAAEHGTDLILLSSHRLGAERPLAAIGTISHKVAVLAECPVLLVK
jgi:universal stress protein A